VAGCEAKSSLHLFLLYAKFEEEFGLLKRAMDIYNRAAEACAPEDRQKTYFIAVARCAEFFGITRCREIYETAMQKLGDKELKPVCLRYAALEKRLGEVDRARAIYVYGAQFADPRMHADYWETWHEFEVHHGNQDTFKEMLRIKRTITAQYSQASLMGINVGAAAQAVAPKDDMAALEAEAAADQEEAQTMKSAETKAAQAMAAQAAAAEANPDEIDLDASDDEDNSDDDEDMGAAPAKGGDVEEQAVPAAVYGSATSGDSTMGARERFKKASK
jgi:pre-mRNA-splicing factor SYF1